MTRKHQHLPQCNLTTSLVYLPSHLRQSHLRQSQLQHRHSKLCLRPLLMLRARLRGPQVERMRGLQRKGGGRWFWRGLCMMMAPTGRNWTAFITTFSVASNSILWIFKSHTANTLSTKDPINQVYEASTYISYHGLCRDLMVYFSILKICHAHKFCHWGWTGLWGRPKRVRWMLHLSWWSFGGQHLVVPWQSYVSFIELIYFCDYAGSIPP